MGRSRARDRLAVPRAHPLQEGRRRPHAARARRAGAALLRILVTGATGQLGRALQESRRPQDELLLADHASMPVEDAAAVAAFVSKARPEWILHAAALTDVDACERDPERARLVNAEGAAYVAEAAAKAGARMLHVSTDYVFDGRAGPYGEDAPAAPINAYGRAKLEGERRVLATLGDAAAVARTAVVFGPHKRNFTTWLVAELRAGRRVRVAEDQWVSPTLADDLARQLLALIDHGASGVWHTAGATRLSRLELAREAARVFGLDASLIDPVRAADLPWVAPRPRDSSLDVTKVSRLVRPLPAADALLRLRERMPS